MLEDGIYFNLSDSEYHDDFALGSTNLKTLINVPEDYWFEKFKENRVETSALIYGKQIHKCVLEGCEAFKDTYAPYIGNLTTKAGKEAFEVIKNTGKIPVKEDDFNKILEVDAQIKQNPSIDRIFKNGIAEVSVIWSDEQCGLRFKARFDYLRKNAIIDLKTLSNPNNKTMNKAARDAIASYNYLISAAHYINGRKQMKKLYQAGKIFGSHNDELLNNIVDTDYFGFIFVFWKKTLAPIAHALQLSPQNEVFSIANSQIMDAIDNYKDFYSEFGLSADKEWRRDTAIEELSFGDLPAWYKYENKDISYA